MVRCQTSRFEDFSVRHVSPRATDKQVLMLQTPSARFFPPSIRLNFDCSSRLFANCMFLAPMREMGRFQQPSWRKSAALPTHAKDHNDIPREWYYLDVTSKHSPISGRSLRGYKLKRHHDKHMCRDISKPSRTPGRLRAFLVVEKVGHWSSYI